MKYPKPKDYPELVLVRETNYRVCWAPRLREGDMGACDDDMKLIVISKKQDAREMFKTFWHEVLHGFEREHRLKLGHPRIRALEELIVSVLEQMDEQGEKK